MNSIFKTIAALFYIICHTFTFAQTVNYTGSLDIIANPERGLQKYSITSAGYATTPGTNNLSVTTMNGWKTNSDKVTVVYRYFLLDAFMSSNINSTYLNNIQTDFDNIRTAGLKVIVRFSYSNAQGPGPQQPTKAQILTHIGQLSPILHTNKDVIFSQQAGFIGTWGEWYYTNSSEFGTDGSINSTQWDNRQEIVDSMLGATPVEIPIQVRYAQIKQTMYGSTPLNDVTAYQNTPQARVGFFNDAFLNDWGDQGTYSIATQCTNPVGTADYNYISNETKYLPMTGETNGLNGCDGGFRTTGANAMNEMRLTNWTTINRDYFTPFWDNAITSGHYDDIVSHVGYRFVMNSSTITSHDTTFTLNMKVANIGFARAFKERNAYLILKNVSTSAETIELINTDIRTWDDTLTFIQDFGSGLTGDFELYLWLPDIDNGLQSNPDYSIQFANIGTWDAVTGYNDLQQTVTLGSVTSVDETTENEYFSIYPNPASDRVIIDLKNSDSETVQIYNSIGQLIKKIKVMNDQSLHVSDLKSGVYFIQLEDNKASFQKLVKK